MTGSVQKVFIVDDDEDIRRSLSRALRRRGFAVETFASAAEFLDTFQADQLGCLVLDYGMPEMNGLELQEHLNRAGINIPIIFVTGHGGVPESVRAIKGGAVDFLEKPFRQTALIEHISTAFEMNLARGREQGERAAAAQRFDRLTVREREIAQLIVTQPSDASSKHIARALDISPRTVDHHRARILEKMGVRSVAELVDIANKSALFG